MQREQVTLQGPVKKRQPHGMSDRDVFLTMSGVLPVGFFVRGVYHSLRGWCLGDRLGELGGWCTSRVFLSTVEFFLSTSSELIFLLPSPWSLVGGWAQAHSCSHPFPTRLTCEPMRKR